jgi:hypothetical protein
MFRRSIPGPPAKAQTDCFRSDTQPANDPMKVYIQRISDRRYYAGNTEWCKDRASARTYASTLQALNEVTGNLQMSDTEMIMTFDPEREALDIRLGSKESRSRAR